jgi:hypothetical protein
MACASAISPRTFFFEQIVGQFVLGIRVALQPPSPTWRNAHCQLSSHGPARGSLATRYPLNRHAAAGGPIPS